MIDDVARHLMSAAVRRAYEHNKEDELLEPIVRVDSSGLPVGRIAHRDFACV